MTCFICGEKDACAACAAFNRPPAPPDLDEFGTPPLPLDE